MSQVGFRIRSQFERPTQELVQQAAQLPTPNLGDCMNRVQCMSPEIRPFGKKGVKMCGVAFTVKSRTGDNLMLHKALDMAQPGDVIVCDAGGDMRQAIMGELMTQYAMTRGIAGIVIDGPIRDSGSMAELPMPVYAKGATPAGPYKDGPGEINFPVTCGGVVVNPGDIVVGDDDGVVVIPAGEAAQVIAEATAHHHKEERFVEEIAAGTWDRSWIDKTLNAKGCQYL